MHDINNLDSGDIGLKQIMGDRFQDETVESAQAEKTASKTHNPTHAAKAAHRPAQEPTGAEARWQPTKERNWMDSVKECTKSVLIFGGLNLLIFYWQQTGLMDASIAMPSMCVCAALAGFGVGKNFAKGWRE